MEFGPGNSSALSMSRLSGGAASPDSAEITKVLRLVLGGDSAAFEQIITRYERRVMTVAMRILGGPGGIDEARDAAQEVFLRVFKYLHRVDLEKPFEPWLMRVTVNVCHDLGRKRRRHQGTALEFDTAVSMTQATHATTGNPHAGLASEQERQLLQKALGNLAEHERIAIVLRDVEGMSTAEVAEIVQAPEATVRSRVSRGRLKLKEDIDRMLGGAQ